MSFSKMIRSRDPRLVAAQRVRGVIDRAAGQQRGELVPEGLQQP